MSKFTVNYDDQPDEIVDKISDALKEFGLQIDFADDEEHDGQENYVIFKYKE